MSIVSHFARAGASSWSGANRQAVRGPDKALGAAIIGSIFGRLIKKVIIVDEDIDPFNRPDGC
jgi:hypothetical protein